MNEISIFIFIHTGGMTEKVQRGSVSEEVEPDMPVAKPKDNLKVILSHGNVTETSQQYYYSYNFRSL